MIRVHVGAVLRVRDGFTGRAMPPSALICTMDGAPCRPVGKGDGYLVFTDLTDGPHRLSLKCRGYQEEWVEFEADGGTREIDVTMKPGIGYPFRQDVTRLTLTVIEKKAPAGGKVLWIAAAGPELKIAQTKAEAGDTESRIFSKGNVPTGTYLIEDGKESEIVVLKAVEGEKAFFSEPLKKGHSRSRNLYPAQRYHTGEDGVISAVFGSPCAVQIYSEDAGLVGSIELIEGENRSEVKL